MTRKRSLRWILHHWKGIKHDSDIAPIAIVNMSWKVNHPEDVHGEVPQTYVPCRDLLLEATKADLLIITSAGNGTYVNVSVISSFTRL